MRTDCFMRCRRIAKTKPSPPRYQALIIFDLLQVKTTPLAFNLRAFYQNKRLVHSKKGRHSSGRNTNVVDDGRYVGPQGELADAVGIERHYNRVAGPE